MRTILASIYLLLLLQLGEVPAAAAGAPTNITVTVYWAWPATNTYGLSPSDYATNVTFNLFASADVTQPLANWTSVTNWPATLFTNQGPIGVTWSNRVPVDASFQFFVMTAGTGRGVSPFSNVAAWLPAPPAGTIGIGK
jgi:hypothetical protein